MELPEPLDPNSPRGIELAASLSQIFAEVELNILARRAAAQLATEHSDTTAA